MKKIVLMVIDLLLHIIAIFVGALLAAIPVFLLWNWLMPEIFGITKVTIIQAYGISALCGCLFKSGH